MAAILRYNNSVAYARNVLGWAGAYATGVVPVDLPPITGPVPPIADAHLDAPQWPRPGPAEPGCPPTTRWLRCRCRPPADADQIPTNLPERRSRPVAGPCPAPRHRARRPSAAAVHCRRGCRHRSPPARILPGENTPAPVPPHRAAGHRRTPGRAAAPVLPRVPTGPATAAGPAPPPPPRARRHRVFPAPAPPPHRSSRRPPPLSRPPPPGPRRGTAAASRGPVAGPGRLTAPLARAQTARRSA